MSFDNFLELTRLINLSKTPAAFIKTQIDTALFCKIGLHFVNTNMSSFSVIYIVSIELVAQDVQLFLFFMLKS